MPFTEPEQEILIDLLREQRENPNIRKAGLNGYIHPKMENLQYKNHIMHLVEIHALIGHSSTDGYNLPYFLQVSDNAAREIDALQSNNRFFVNDEGCLKGTNQMFKKLPSNSRALLKQIIESDNPGLMLINRFMNCSPKEDLELRGILKELRDGGYINMVWASNVPYDVVVYNPGRTYFEQEAEYERQTNNSQRSVVHIDNSGNFVLGNVTGSSLSVVNSIEEIENEIQAKGGDDKQILMALLKEAIELTTQIKANQPIPHKEGFATRLSTHLAKHGWFYGAIINLLGQAVLMKMGN